MIAAAPVDNKLLGHQLRIATVAVYTRTLLTTLYAFSAAVQRSEL